MRQRPRAARTAVLALVATLVLAGCGAGEREGAHQPPRDGAAGLQLSGTFGGRQLAVSDGAPALLTGAACRQRMGAGAELCVRSRDIDGGEVLLAFLNPAVVRPGAELAVGRGDCREPEDCAAVGDVAVIEVQAGGQRQRATSGTLSLREVVPGARYAGRTTLGFRDGSLSGSFDLVPRPDQDG